MPRQKRQKSATGIYHVILRGINKQIIFEDVEDYKKMLWVIGDYKNKCGFKLYAYCLMGNHVHLLIEEKEESIGCIFRKIGAKYVLWYNRKYERSGHLFQGRFISEVVENESYFFTLLKYIHQNPIKAKMAQQVNAYDWTSYDAYINGNALCDTQRIIEYLSLEGENGKEKIIEMLHTLTEERCLEFDDSYGMSDANASAMIRDIANIERPKLLAEFKQEDRNLLLVKLKGKGITYKQMERLTGINLAVIRAVMHEEDEKMRAGKVGDGG